MSEEALNEELNDGQVDSGIESDTENTQDQNSDTLDVTSEAENTIETIDPPEDEEVVTEDNSEALQEEVEQEPSIPTYQCHKQVQAFQIAHITSEGGTDMLLHPTKDAGHPGVKVSGEYMRRAKPYTGGYYVLYEDGYESFSPEEAFENGYTLAVEGGE